MLDERLISGFGSDYIHCKQWLKSLDDFDEIKTAMEAQSPGELATFQETADDVTSIVGMVLAYNTMVFRFPTMKVADRQQVPPLAAG